MDTLALDKTLVNHFKANTARDASQLLDETDVDMEGMQP